MRKMALKALSQSASLYLSLGLAVGCSNSLQFKMAGGTEKACIGDACPQISAIQPIAAVPGSAMRLLGKNLSQVLQLSVDGVHVDASLTNESELIFTMPPGKSGYLEIEAKTETSFVTAPKVYRIADGYYSIIALDSNSVCKDQEFYTFDGEVMKGTKDCSEGAALDRTNLKPENILTGITIAGVTGSFMPAGEEVVLAGTSYGAPSAPMTGRLSLPSAGKVLSGISYGSSETPITGTLSLPLASSVRSGSVAYGDPGAALTPSYSPDFPDVANVLNIDTTDTVAGTLTIPVATNVRVGNGAYGVGGTGSTPTLADCTSANQSACVATNSYKTMDLSTVSGVGLTSSNFNASLAAAPTFEFWTATGARQTVAGDTDLSVGNIKSGANIFGKVGDYPSATYKLPSASATLDLDAATFDAKVKSAAAFEYWNSAGTYQTGTGDDEITATNIVSTITIFGTTGSAAAASCTYLAQGTCEADAACRWNTGACEINPWNIRIGTTVGGMAGALRTNCRNIVNTTYYNWDGVIGSLPNTSSNDVSTNYDYWDTVDDFYGFPANRVTAFSSDTFCDSSVWSDVTTIDGGTSFVACGTSSQCIYQDNLSGLKVTGILAAGGNTTGSPTSVAWNAAVQLCAASTYGGYTAGTWRLPTQKEVMALYEHSIISIAGPNFMTKTQMQDNFWSSSSSATFTIFAWSLSLGYGYSNDNSKNETFYVACVR